jgi:CPA2 family monovalent cation:H+ antiporter-2
MPQFPALPAIPALSALFVIGFLLVVYQASRYPRVMGELTLVQDLAIITLIAGVAGFLCQRIGLSTVLGFLLAGLLVGPHSPILASISDQGRIETLSQLGLVFLMFSIGLELSLAKLRRMGLGLMLAVGLGALLVFSVARTICPLLGIGQAETPFVASMLLASSSAIIAKVLSESGLSHQRAGTLAISITVLEDTVAIVVLTLLSSAAQMQRAPQAGIGKTLGVLLVFVTIVIVVGLLLLPRVLRRLNAAGSDLLTIGVAGLVLGIAVLAVKIGSSLALGAFLLGAIIAETPQRPTVERAMLGMRDLFVAVFFVSIGMLLDPALLLKHWVLALSLGLITILLRAVAVTLALTITGTEDREAVRTGLMATPVCEFAFIIAQVGASSQVLSADYYPAAFGIALSGALISPLLIKNSARLSHSIVRMEPRPVRRLLRLYQDFLASVSEHQQRSQVILLARQRFPMLVISVVIASAILVFAPLLHQQWAPLFSKRLGPWNDRIFWVLIGIAITGPLLGVWHRLSNFLASLVDLALGGESKRGILQVALEVTAACLLFLWIWFLKPTRVPLSFFCAIGVTALVYLLVFGRKLRKVHHELDTQLAEAILSSEERREKGREDWLKEHQEWDLTLSDIRVPDSEAWFGKTLGDLGLRSQFGCSVVGVERQGYPVPSPGPDTELFPNDLLLVLGKPDQIQRVRTFFQGGPTKTEQADLLQEIRLESIQVPERSRLNGAVLAELDIARNTGVQIVGLSRGEHRMLFPGPFQMLEAGDWLLVVGARDQIQKFREWISS